MSLLVVFKCFPITHTNSVVFGPVRLSLPEFFEVDLCLCLLYYTIWVRSSDESNTCSEGGAFIH